MDTFEILPSVMLWYTIFVIVVAIIIAVVIIYARFHLKKECQSNRCQEEDGIDCFAPESELTAKSVAPHTRMSTEKVLLQVQPPSPELAHIDVPIRIEGVGPNESGDLPTYGTPPAPKTTQGTSPTPRTLKLQWLIIAWVAFCVVVAIWITIAIVSTPYGDTWTATKNWVTAQSWQVVAFVIAGTAVVAFLIWLVRHKSASQNQGGQTPQQRTQPTTEPAGPWSPWFRSTLKGMLIMATGVLLLVGFNQGILPRFVNWANSPRASAATMVTSPPAATSIVNQPWEVVRQPIADCESGDGGKIGTGKQFEADGSVVMHLNTNGTIDFGKYQINSVHNAELERRKKEGREINIMTEAGNEEFARILYERAETSDWNSSQKCWGSKVLATGGMSSQLLELTSLVNAPATISVLPGWRWDLVGNIPDGVRWSNAHRDRDGNRIQIFDLVPPKTEATVFSVKISKCKTIAGCAW